MLGVESSYFVKVLSSEDADSHMVETASELCRAVQRQEIGHDQIDVSMVEQRCKGYYSTMDCVCVCVCVCACACVCVCLCVPEGEGKRKERGSL